MPSELGLCGWLVFVQEAAEDGSAGDLLAGWAGIGWSWRGGRSNEVKARGATNVFKIAEILDLRDPA
jgi:hypothetical protein